MSQGRVRATVSRAERTRTAAQPSRKESRTVRKVRKASTAARCSAGGSCPFMEYCQGKSMVSSIKSLMTSRQAFAP